MNITFIKCILSSLLLVFSLSSSRTLQADQPVLPDFDAAMVCHPRDEKILAKLNRPSSAAQPMLSYLREQYQQFCLNVGKEPIVTRIPKIIHQIWIGPKPFPKKCELWKASWLAMNPDWQYKLWTNEDATNMTLINRNFFDEETNWGAKSDLLRYEILHQFGGLYVDVDFECIKPFDWLHESCDFYASFFEPARLKQTGRFANGIIACAPGHPLTKNLIDEVVNFRHEEDLIKRVGPNFFSTVIKKYIKDCPGTNIIFPSNFFFSWSNRKVIVQPETMAIHYYTATWSKKSFRFN